MSNRSKGTEEGMLVSSGIIQVSLAVTGVGFLIKESEVKGAQTALFSGGIVFYIGALISLVLCLSYLAEWGDRNLDSNSEKNRRGWRAATLRWLNRTRDSWAITVAWTAHLALLLLMIFLFFTLALLFTG